MNRFTLLATSFLLASSLLASGQTNYPRHEINLGYGYLSKEQIHNGVLSLNKVDKGPSDQEQIISKLYEGTGLNPSLSDIKRTGAVVLGYKIAVTHWLWAGVSVAFDKEHSDISTWEKTDSRYIKVGSYSRTALSIAAEAKAVYFAKGLVSIYGSAGFGSCIIDQKIEGNTKTDNRASNYFTLHLSPFGLRIGRKAGGFLETGFGYKGICHLGFNYQL
jgi:hypothetical protein